jgi:hypothetical protein
MTEHVKELLAENLSILLIDNMTNEIIGCRGLAMCKKGGADFSLKTTNKEWRHIWAFVEHTIPDVRSQNLRMCLFCLMPIQTK